MSKLKLDITQSHMYNRRLAKTNVEQPDPLPFVENVANSRFVRFDRINNPKDTQFTRINEEIKPPSQTEQRRFNEYSDINEYLKNGYQPLPYPPPSWTPSTPEKERVLQVMSQLNSLGCSGCDKGFEPNDQIINSNGEVFHPQCFVCAQCFKPFEANEVYYEYDGRKYCEHDFQVLYAPFCGKCGEFIIGRVIKALNCNWHPLCFRCDMCNIELADQGFFRHAGKALCRDCHAKVKAEGIGKYVCHKCHGIIDDGPLRFRGEVYHPYHFNCAKCDVELTSDAREVTSRPGYTSNEVNELYCLRCHDNMGIPICGACRRPIEERIVTALGKHWHVEHFVCAKCEKPFMGNRHYEKKGLAYCETHYHQLFGNLCFVCNQVIGGDVFTALNKAWCVHHFSCSLCDIKMNQRTKFFEMDLKPVCKKCYERLPAELRKRLKKYHDMVPKIKTFI